MSKKDDEKFEQEVNPENNDQQPKKNDNEDNHISTQQERTLENPSEKVVGDNEEKGKKGVGNKNSKKPKVQLVIGDPLEYRIARLFIKQGYFVRRGINIYTTAYIDTATDIDVLAIKYSDSFTRTTVISECKSGDSRPLDRIFWLSGLKNYLNASKAILVRRPTRWNIKDFAKEAGIEILDLDRIVTLEETVEIDPMNWLGYSDRDFFVTHAKAWNEILRNDEYLAEMFLTFSGEARFIEPFGAMNYYLHHMRTLIKIANNSNGAKKSLIKYLLGDAASQLMVFIMETCRISFDLTTKDRQGLIEKKFTYGELDPDFSKRIFDHAYALSKQAASHYAGTKIEMDRSLFDMPRPDYVDDLIAYIEYLISRMTKIHQLVYACDLLFAETFVKDNSDFNLKDIIEGHNYRFVVQALDQFIRMLSKLKCLPQDFRYSFKI